MNDFITFLFALNPGRAEYGSPSMLGLLSLCAGLIVLSFAIKFWRGRVTNSITRKLSRTWGSISFWFGVAGIVLVVCRVENIQLLAMRFLWVLWAALFLFFLVIQIKIFRSRHYEVLPRATAPEDPRAKYLPGRKR